MMKRLNKSWRLGLVSGLLIGMFILLVPFASLQGAQGFKPKKPVEFTIMAGTGGGADIYARFIAGVIEKNKAALGVPELTLLPTNRAGGSGAVAMQFLNDLKGDAADHTIAISLDSFIMTPLIQGLPYTWRDFKGIALLALDNFFLWVTTDDANNKYKTPADFIKDAKDRALTSGGTGTFQEDQLIIDSITKALGFKPTKYVPFSGGGAVATALVGKQVEFTVNNPSECLPFYPDKCKPLWTFATKRHEKDERFKTLPTLKELGTDFTYQMIRAVYGPPAMSKEAVAYYTDLMKKVFALDEFQKFFDTEVLDDKLLVGDDLAKFVEAEALKRCKLMVQVGWDLKKKEPGC
ncbi:tripartite tricarboxylate transporter substrate binding protein [Candidatus Acetothermia bacterium]|nr:tripartite tricarboxylate transporter substrate binding protein [Candidatus Acetothermia bacterium]